MNPAYFSNACVHAQFSVWCVDEIAYKNTIEQNNQAPMIFWELDLVSIWSKMTFTILSPEVALTKSSTWSKKNALPARFYGI